ncbi:WD40 repeat-containing protein [Tieghemostelium lacteum]|uniref:WD40 repeat-containing protein n=1 Tax=Tieghemostelium lacteum TaxID=361077 RepID=A0A151Z5B4_TIELA|nr:WD40 repeat-containing protein [Tieghemostelium lacteum]|eukprot:KYQ89128.1 WD40 repeat-containing protein [Tieghemostelium lacteum]
MASNLNGWIQKECEQRETIVIDMVFSLCGNYLVACNNFGCVNVWDLKESLHPNEIQQHVTNENGYSDQPNPFVNIFNTQQQQQQQQQPNGSSSYNNMIFKPSLSFLADSTKSPINKLFFYSEELLVSSGDSDIMVWNWTKIKNLIGEPGQRINVSDIKQILICNLNSPRIEGIKGHLPERAEINGLDSDGRFLYFACGNNNAYSCDLSTLKIVNTYQGHQDYVLSIKYNSTFNQIITSSEDSTVRIWDPNSSQTTSILNPFYKLSYDMSDINNNSNSNTNSSSNNNNNSNDNDFKLPPFLSTEKTKKSSNFNQWCGPLDLDETGNWLVVGGSTLSLWYLGRLNTMVANLPADDCIHSVLVNKDQILACGSEGTVNYYSPEGRLQMKVPSTSKILYSLAHNPKKSNQILATGGSSPLINIYINQENIAFSYYFLNE